MIGQRMPFRPTDLSSLALSAWESRFWTPNHALMLKYSCIQHLQCFQKFFCLFCPKCCLVWSIYWPNMLKTAKILIKILFHFYFYLKRYCQFLKSFSLILLFFYKIPTVLIIKYYIESSTKWYVFSVWGGLCPQTPPPFIGLCSHSHAL